MHNTLKFDPGGLQVIERVRRANGKLLRLECEGGATVGKRDGVGNRKVAVKSAQEGEV